MNFFRNPPSALGLLSERDFRRYFVADAMFDLGAELRRVSMGWIALGLTGSPLWVGLITGIPGLTMALFAPLAGVAVDRYDRRNILVWVRLSFAAIAFAIGALVLLDAVSVWHLLAVSLVVGAIHSISLPALRAFITDLVGRRRLMSANALTGASSSAGELAGPLLAGFVIAAFGVGPVFLIASFVFGVCGLMLLRVARRPARSSSREPFLSQLSQGIAYVYRTPPLPALLVVTLTQLPSAVIIPLIPVYAREPLGVGAAGYGVMSAALGVGFLAGSLVTVAVGDLPKKGLLLVLTALVWDVSTVGFGFSRLFPLSLGLLFAMGVAGSLHVITLLTLFQTITRDDMQGRVLSIYGVLASSFPLGFVLGGALAEAFGGEVAILLGTLGSTPPVAAAYLMSREMRRR